MKYKVECNSPLLQFTLEYFLKNKLDESGVLITDNPEKNGILIGQDIKKPFTKTSLIIQLENKKTSKKEFSLEEKINLLTDKFKEELFEILKEHYGEKQY